MSAASPAVAGLLCVAVGLLVAQDQQPGVDPAVRTAIERFYATQQAEDVDAYLALWSSRAQRPRPEQLKYIFDSGDDRFTNITLGRVVQTGNRVRVRVSVVRERTPASQIAAPGALRVQAMTVALAFVHEDGEWKLLREGTPADDLAAELIEAASPADRAALVDAEPDLAGPALLRALGQRASGAAQRLEYGEAERLFNLVIEIARTTGDRAAEGEALQNLGNTFYFRGRHPDALAAYVRRLAIEHERNDDPGIASALLGIATIRYAYAEYGPALTAYREALTLQERLGDESAIATTLVSTGNVLYLQGDFEAAIADYRRSQTLGRETGNVDAESRALEGLGRVFAAQGDFAAALDAFAGVLADAEARNDGSRQAAARQHIGDIHFKLGNLDEARTAFEKSRRHYETAGDAANVGRLWQAVALTDLVAARFELAEKEYTTSISVCAAAADRECVARATAGLGFAQAAQEQFDAAIASYAKAIDAFTTMGRREDAARAEVGRAQAFTGKGDLDDALTAAAHARHAAVALGNDDVLWRALVAETRVLRRKGDPVAVGAARAAVAAVERLRQFANERPGTVAPADGDVAFATLAVVQAEAGDPAAAFATSEQMRLYRLRGTLAPHERDIARGTSPEQREEERASAAQLASLGAQLTRERSLPKPDPARIERLEKTLAEALARRAAQQQRLFQRLPELRSWRALAQPADASLIECVLLSHGSTLVDFVVDEDDLLTFVAVREEGGVALSAHVTPMPRRKLAERLHALLQPEVLRSARDWERMARDFLATWPSEAVTQLAAASDLLVIPDETLWRLPVDALPAPGGYIADHASVAYSSSLTAALQQSTARHRATSTAWLAVAAPEISPSLRKRVAATAPGWRLREGDFAPAEIDRADGAGSILSDADATERRVRERAAIARFLHFASPFRVNAASPLFSPLLLAGDAAESHDDGVLEAREIMNLELSAEVTILSDRAALAMRDAAGALDAIEWAWRSAGVPSIVLTRWSSDDRASDALLAELHRRLSAGDTTSAAIRAARAKLRARAATAAPFYWAGWMLIAQQPGRARQ